LDAVPAPVSDDFEGAAVGSMVRVGLAELPEEPAAPEEPAEPAEAEGPKVAGLLGE
jgi:hypothetical protein